MVDAPLVATPLTFTASDGTRLSLDHFRDPRSTGSRPVVLTQTPYLKGDTGAQMLPITALVAAGYDCVVADIRGTGGSEGVFLGPLSTREADDGAELVEWLSTQWFSDGAVALAGVSYPGAIQFLTAARRPRGLRCIAPGVAPIDFYRDWTHRGGIPQHSNWGALTFLQANQPARSVGPALAFYYGVAQATSEDGEMFWERSPAHVLDQIEVPVLLLGGLFDYFSRGSIRAFDALDVPKRLVLGPWGHEYPEDTAELVRWLDHWMKGEGDDPSARENTRTWVLGRDEWVTSTGRFRPERFTTLAIDPEGRTVPVLASRHALPLAPPSPVPVLMDTSTSSGMHLWGELDQVELDLAPESLVEGTPVLALSFSLHDCSDADLNVRLSIAREDGTVQQLTEGRLRLSHWRVDEDRSTRLDGGEIESVHHSHVGAAEVVPGETIDTLIEFLPTCFELRLGDRLLLGLTPTRVDGDSARGSLRLHATTALSVPVRS